MRRYSFNLYLHLTNHHLGKFKILGIINIDPLDRPHNSHIRRIAHTAMMLHPHIAPKNIKSTRLHIHRLNSLRARNRGGSIIERLALVPSKCLNLLCRKSRIVTPLNNLLDSLADSGSLDKRRCSMRKHIHIGINITHKSIVNLLPQRSVAVERSVAQQQLHTGRQQRTHLFAAAIDIHLVNAGNLSKSLQQITHHRLATQQLQVFTHHALAIQTNGNKCNNLHYYI